jgi:transcriptional regulator with XRE-family HTH domain
MDTAPDTTADPIASKIKRLVEERGWNQEDFARIAQLNRQTVRTILHEGNRKLRNSTISSCARALGVAVNDLQRLPIEQLLSRVSGPVSGAENALRRLYERASHPELVAWLERNSDRARQMTADDVGELLALQESNAALTAFGVERLVDILERKRRLVAQVQAIAASEYLELLEKLVALMHERIQSYGERR